MMKMTHEKPSLFALAHAKGVCMISIYHLQVSRQGT